jgi:hypothetical protein
MSGQNLRHQRVLARLATAPTAEQRAAQARDFAKRHPHSASLRYELERADRIQAQLQADALLRRIRAAGEVGCDAPAECPLTLRSAVRDGLYCVAAITAMLAFGWLFREPLARALVALGVL